MNAQIWGKSERLDSWWEVYVTSLPERYLGNFRPRGFCWTACEWGESKMKRPIICVLCDGFIGCCSCQWDRLGSYFIPLAWLCNLFTVKMFPRAHTDGDREFETVLSGEQEHNFGTAMGTEGREENVWRKEERQMCGERKRQMCGGRKTASETFRHVQKKLCLPG